MIYAKIIGLTLGLFGVVVALWKGLERVLREPGGVRVDPAAQKRTRDAAWQRDMKAERIERNGRKRA